MALKLKKLTVKKTKANRMRKISKKATDSKAALLESGNLLGELFKVRSVLGADAQLDLLIGNEISNYKKLITALLTERGIASTPVQTSATSAA